MGKPRYSVEAVYEHGALVAYQLVSDQGYFSAMHLPTEAFLTSLKSQADLHNGRQSTQTRTTIYP